VLVQQSEHLVGAETGGALGRTQALGIEAVGDGAGAAAGGGQSGDQLQQPWVIGELVQVGDGADGLAAGGVAAGPGDGDVDEFAAADHGDGDVVDHGAQEFLAVGGGGGGRRRRP
jgi:hypothetical protein